VSELTGRTVLVTREEPEGGPLSSALAAKGATVVLLPLLETRPPADPAELAREAARLAEYDWVIFTSARAVEALAGATGARNGSETQVAVVGEGTARAARRFGWEPKVIGRAGGVALVAALRDDASIEGRSVLFPAADHARPDTILRLREAGARVHVVTAYRTLPRLGAATELAARLSRPGVDAVVFTSPSAVETLGDVLGSGTGRTRFAAIGTTTRDRLEAAGARDVVMPDRPDFEALARALACALSPG
jgi:uroporphyrinogen-III synthase